MRTRDLEQDETLGLNCAWYADILMTLTGPQPKPATQGTAATATTGAALGGATVTPQSLATGP